MAALAIEYGAPLAAKRRVATLEIITISPRPRVRICGINSWLRWNGPMTWTANNRSGSVGSVLTTLWPRLLMPALLTKISTAPKSWSTSAASLLASSRRSTEAA